MALNSAGLGPRTGSALLLALVACASLPPGGDSRHCDPPDFPYANGWLGGDAAYSIALGPHTSLWLFGDTFVRPSASLSEPVTRQGAELVHNSIALTTCTADGKWTFDYNWGRNPDGSAAAFLETRREGLYWWLFDGFIHRDALYIGLLVVEESEPRGALGLPFRFVGVELARIENFRAPPDQWRAEILPLSDDKQAFPVSSLVLADEYLYLFAFLAVEPDRSPRALARLPLAALEGKWPSRQLEYLANSGDWKPGLDASDARLLMADDASEMSVRFHPELGRWLAVYSYPSLEADDSASRPSDRVTLRTAKHIEGPWSEPRSIYRVPELSGKDASESDPNTFCYAAKEHPQLAPDGQLVISYVCNLFARKGEDALAVLGRLLDQMDLYRPRTVAIPFTEIELHESP